MVNNVYHWSRSWRCTMQMSGEWLRTTGRFTSYISRYIQMTVPFWIWCRPGSMTREQDVANDFSISSSHKELKAWVTWKNLMFDRRSPTDWISEKLTAFYTRRKKEDKWICLQSNEQPIRWKGPLLHETTPESFIQSDEIMKWSAIAHFVTTVTAGDRKENARPSPATAVAAARRLPLHSFAPRHHFACLVVVLQAESKWAFLIESNMNEWVIQ